MRADSLLLTGARSKNIQMIELAISLDGDVNVTDEIGRTPLNLGVVPWVYTCYGTIIGT